MCALEKLKVFHLIFYPLPVRREHSSIFAYAIRVGWPRVGAVHQSRNEEIYRIIYKMRNGMCVRFIYHRQHFLNFFFAFSLSPTRTYVVVAKFLLLGWMKNWIKVAAT